MNIVIIGAGAIGSYVAALLSQEENDVTLVDTDQGKLDRLSRGMDIASRQGSGTDWQLLDQLTELKPDLLAALTPRHEINLVSCAIAKNLGFPKTIARVTDPIFFQRSVLDFERIFHVDHFIAPDILVAQDIFKTIISPEALSVETFAHGAIQMRTVQVPKQWRHGDKKLYQLGIPRGMMIGLIRRPTGNDDNSHEPIIFPHGNDVILPGDEMTVIGESDVIDKYCQPFAGDNPKVGSAVIMGGSNIAVCLARILVLHGIRVRLIEQDYQRCCDLAEQLNGITLIHHDGTEMEFLKGERIDNTDVFICCTGKDETNLLAAALAKQLGCRSVISVLADTHYLSLVRKLGISHAVSPRISAANRVLAVAREHSVSSMISMYEGEAEILELKVSPQSKFIGIPLAELGPSLPKDFLIAVIQNRGRIMVAHGARILSPGDTIVLISHPRHIKDLEEIF